jgi:fatty-acyl-CoA synthase
VHTDLEHLLVACDIPRVVIDDSDAPGTPYAAFLDAASPEDFGTPFEPSDDEEVISINYTSGTTGRQKGVMYTHRGAYLNALGEIIEVGYRPDTVFLWTLPMFHCNGWCNTWAVTAVGGTHICLRNVESEEIWRMFEDEGVTHYCGAPVVHIGVVNHPAAHRLPKPVTVAVAAAPPSPTLLAEMQSLNLWPRHLYGLTETYGPHTVCKWQAPWDELPDAERAERLARQGVSFLDIEPVRVVDEDMRDVPSDGATLGEVVMRGNNVMKGYWRDEEATANAFRGGWFHSGDMGVMHADGYLELRDRAKDIIISGGENISTIEVEQAIAAHPAVLECAVVATPDERWGERPKAFVTARPGAEVDEVELIAFCRGRLAHFKCPAAVEFGPLPKTSTGKTQKYILREREWSGRAKRIG